MGGPDDMAFKSEQPSGDSGKPETIDKESLKGCRADPAEKLPKLSPAGRGRRLFCEERPVADPKFCEEFEILLVTPGNCVFFSTL